MSYVMSEKAAMWWRCKRCYCHPQSPGLGLWGLGIGDRALAILVTLWAFRDVATFLPLMMDGG